MKVKRTVEVRVCDAEGCEAIVEEEWSVCSICGADLCKNHYVFISVDSRIFEKAEERKDWIGLRTVSLPRPYFRECFCPSCARQRLDISLPWEEHDGEDN